MKTVFMVFALLLLTAINFMSQAQQTTEFYPGKWEIVADSPQGKVIFTVHLEREEGKLTGNIQRQGEATPVKLKNVEEKGKEDVILYFSSSSGYDVAFHLKKKDENNVSGKAQTDMGAYDISGERIK